MHMAVVASLGSCGQLSAAVVTHHLQVRVQLGDGRRLNELGGSVLHVHHDHGHLEAGDVACVVARLHKRVLQSNLALHSAQARRKP